MKSLKQNDTLVIIPVFNEENNVGSVISELLNYQATIGYDRCDFLRTRSHRTSIVSL